MVERRRKRVGSDTTAAGRAAEIVPDISTGVEAPPHEAASTRVDAESSRGPWGTVIDSVIQVDPEATYARLRHELTLGPDHVSYAIVAAALDQADANYFESVILARAAKLEEQRVEREAEMRLEVLRTAARQELVAEKVKAAEKAKAKTTGKATLEEVRDRCYANWPDEMASLERRRDEYRAGRAVAEELTTAWRSRAASLRELVAGLRGR